MNTFQRAFEYRQIEIIEPWKTYTVAEFQKALADAIEKVPEQYRDKATVDLDSDESRATLAICFYEYESDEAYTARAIAEAARMHAAAMAREQSERALLAELKVKYEGGKP